MHVQHVQEGKCVIMARGNRGNTAELDVDAPEEQDVDFGGNEEGEEVQETVAEEKPAKVAKAKKEPARGDLPEGYVTPVGLAKELTERQLHRDREGNIKKVEPQMVYSYINNAPKDNPFPLEVIQDSLGKDRKVCKVEAGIAWWEAKNTRVSERRQNAAAKAVAKAERAAKKAEEPTAEAEAEAEASEEVTEAE